MIFDMKKTKQQSTKHIESYPASEMLNLLAVNLTLDFERLNTCQAVFNNEYDYGRCYVAFVNYTCSLSVEFEQHS